MDDYANLSLNTMLDDIRAGLSFDCRDQDITGEIRYEPEYKAQTIKIVVKEGDNLWWYGTVDEDILSIRENIVVVATRSFNGQNRLANG